MNGMSEKEAIHITDVAPRDGLQNQAIHLATADKLRLIELLVEAGVRSIEAASFVSPKAVPQMADAADLVPQVQARFPALRTSVLVPNLKGLERAHAADAQEIAVVLSASETMNRHSRPLSCQRVFAADDTQRGASKACRCCEGQQLARCHPPGDRRAHGTAGPASTRAAAGGRCRNLPRALCRGRQLPRRAPRDRCPDQPALAGAHAPGRGLYRQRRKR